MEYVNKTGKKPPRTVQSDITRYTVSGKMASHEIHNRITKRKKCQPEESPKEKRRNLTTQCANNNERGLSATGNVDTVKVANTGTKPNKRIRKSNRIGKGAPPRQEDRRTDNALKSLTSSDIRRVKNQMGGEHLDGLVGLETGDFPNPLRTLYVNRGNPRPWVSGEVITCMGAMIAHHANEHVGRNCWTIRDHYVTQALNGKLGINTLEKLFRRHQTTMANTWKSEDCPAHMDLLDVVFLPIQTTGHWILGVIDFTDRDRKARIRILHSMQNIPIDEQPNEWNRDHLASRMIKGFLRPSNILKTNDLLEAATTNWYADGHIEEECPQQKT